MKIAVDAMGGDYAPGVCIEGAAQALYDFPDIELVIVGHEKKLAYYLERYGIARHSRISVVHAETVVEMREPSTTSIRGKKDSSITVCAKLLKEGKVDASNCRRNQSSGTHPAGSRPRSAYYVATEY